MQYIVYNLEVGTQQVAGDRMKDLRSVAALYELNRLYL